MWFIRLPACRTLQSPSAFRTRSPQRRTCCASPTPPTCGTSSRCQQYSNHDVVGACVVQCSGASQQSLHTCVLYPRRGIFRGSRPPMKSVCIGHIDSAVVLCCAATTAKKHRDCFTCRCTSFGRPGCGPSHRLTSAARPRHVLSPVNSHVSGCRCWQQSPCPVVTVTTASVFAPQSKLSSLPVVNSCLQHLDTRRITSVL